MNSSDIFKNYPLNSESWEYNSDDNSLHGGAAEDINTPTGGFLPIYLCGKKEIDTTTEEDKEQRGFDTLKGNIVSIQSILEKRRQIVPFIPK